MFVEFLQDNEIRDDVLAVGVSGGADSLALILMMNEELAPKNVKLVAVTVDHKLRAESTAEAEYVAEVMAQAGIEHHILTWTGAKPHTGVEEAARQARYALIEDFCVKAKIKTLAVAHHQLDQAETFLMRLQRGSGLDGLCGMLPVSKRGKLQIVRPLLNTHPEELKNYLRHKKIAWVEDPSNCSDEFLRVRVRKIMPELEQKLGISAERIVNTMQTLSYSKDCLNAQADQFIENKVRQWQQVGFSFAPKAFNQLPKEIGFRVLSSLLKVTGNREYPPEAKEIRHLQDMLQEENFSGCTLGNCELFCYQGKIWATQEVKNKETLSKKEWDEFCEVNPQYKKIMLPYKLRLSLYKLNPIYK